MSEKGADTSQRNGWKHAVAGCTAGLSTVLALQPLDVIKTRLQVQDGAGSLPLYRGTVDALRSIARDEGWRSLYAGLTPALIGSGVAWGVYFFAYNAAKQRYKELTGQTKLGPVAHLASAVEAGSLVCFITNPIWVVKTRLQLQRKNILQGALSAAQNKIVQQPRSGGAAAGAAAAAAGTAANAAKRVASSSAANIINKAATSTNSIPRGLPSTGGGGAPVVAAYTGFIDCLTQIAQKEGIRGLYKGLLPSLFLVSHGAIQFAVYEELKSAAYHIRDFVHPLGKKDADDRVLSSAEITACGALSKMVASVVTYPSQVVRSRLQQRMDARSLRYKGVVDVLRTTLAREGVSGLYKGLVPNVLRVMPQSALTFLVYETVMHNLQNLEMKRK